MTVRDSRNVAFEASPYAFRYLPGKALFLVQVAEAVTAKYSARFNLEVVDFHCDGEFHNRLLSISASSSCRSLSAAANLLNFLAAK
jgi:hypothetical protein